MPFFKSLFGNDATIKIKWSNEESSQETPIFSSNSDISGVIQIEIPKNVKQIQTNGIKAELIGQIETVYDTGNPYVFVSSQQILSDAGTLDKDTNYSFAFTADEIEKKYETYNGKNVKIRYLIRVTISKSTVKQFEFIVEKISQEIRENREITMEIGIEDVLELQLKYDKDKYGLSDVVTGNVSFNLVRLKIQQMELQLIKKEITGNRPNYFHESETIDSYQIMDGSPYKGDNIPIRLFLDAYNLTPTVQIRNNKLDVKYYLNLLIFDENNRRFFKEKEIKLFRLNVK